MAQGLRRIGRMRDQRRNAAILASSLALHAAVLGYLALHSLDDPRRYGDLSPVQTRPIVFLEIQPRPLLRNETPRPPRPLARLPELNRPPREQTVAALDRSPEPPSPPTPRVGPRNDPSLPADFGEQFWNAPRGGLADRIARNMRSNVGCASPQLLNEAERAACDQRFGERAGNAAPIQGTGDAARDGRFAVEGERALRRYEERRRPLSGRGGAFRPHDGSGSNLGFPPPGAHLRPDLRQDREDDLNRGLGRDRGDPTAPRLPHASTRND